MISQVRVLPPGAGDPAAGALRGTGGGAFPEKGQGPVDGTIAVRRPSTCQTIWAESFPGRWILCLERREGSSKSDKK